MSTLDEPGQYGVGLYVVSVPPVSVAAPGTHMKYARPFAVLSTSDLTVSHAWIHWAAVVPSQSPSDQGYWPPMLNSCANVRMTGCPNDAIAEPSESRKLGMAEPCAPIVVMAGKFDE